MLSISKDKLSEVSTQLESSYELHVGNRLGGTSLLIFLLLDVLQPKLLLQRIVNLDFKAENSFSFGSDFCKYS